MSMMMRRNPPLPGQYRPAEGVEIAPEPRFNSADPRFPEVAGATATALPVATLRQRVEALLAQRFSGYVQIAPTTRGGGPQGVILCHEGQPIDARTDAAEGSIALAQLLTPEWAEECLCAVQPLAEDVALALASTFSAPQLTQPMGRDSGEVAVLLRDLAAVRHSGAVQISAGGAHGGATPWVRILMHEGKFLGVYSVGDRQMKASLAGVGAVLGEPDPQMTLFAVREQIVALPFPAKAMAAGGAPVPIPGATPERDESIETDLVWFMSRFERAFGRLKDRRDPQGDLLRAFGELTNELASFVAALQSGTNAAIATHGIVAAELTRARAAGVVTIDLRLGKAGLDAVAIMRGYGAFPKRSADATAYFAAASGDMLTLIGRLMERMIGAFHDPVAASFAREGCETLLREIRAGLAQLGQR